MRMQSALNENRSSFGNEFNDLFYLVAVSRITKQSSDINCLRHALRDICEIQQSSIEAFLKQVLVASLWECQDTVARTHRDNSSPNPANFHQLSTLLPLSPSHSTHPPHYIHIPY